MAGWLAGLTIGLPWVGAVCVWLARDKRPNLQITLAVFFSLATAAASLGLLAFAGVSVVVRVPFGGAFGDLTLIPDGLGVTLTVIAATIGCLAVIFSIDYMHGEAQLGRYYALVLLFIGAMAGLVLSGSLMWLFMFWEITALCSYALISFNNDDPKAVAGGIKALIITQLAGIGLLVGALTAYSALGTYDIAVLLERADTLAPATLGVIAFAFLIAAAAKSAQVPFHTWLPDAMEAPTPISALIHAATMVNAGIYLLARFYPAFEAVPGWRLVVMIVGVASLLLAGIMALTSYDLKRVLAFSTISQLGYLVYGIGAGGMSSSMFHLVSHAVFKALLFLSAGAVIHAVGTRDMRKMGGLDTMMPFVRNTFVIGAMALAGVPLFNGFLSKELLLESALEGGPFWAYVIALIGAGLTALYITRATYLTFFAMPAHVHHPHSTGTAMRVALGTLAVGTFVTWLLVGNFTELLQSTLPFHEVHVLTTLEAIAELASSWATYVALGVALLGFGLWLMRERLVQVVEFLTPLREIASEGFWFEQINSDVKDLTQRAATALRRTQTGLLSFNLLGIVGALAILLALAWMGVVK